MGGTRYTFLALVLDTISTFSYSYITLGMRLDVAKRKSRGGYNRRCWWREWRFCSYYLRSVGLGLYVILVLVLLLMRWGETKWLDVRGG